MGKHIIVVGADFSDVAIDSRQRVPITTDPTDISVTEGSTQSLSVSSSVSCSFTVTSLDTGKATVSGSAGSYTVSGVAAGSTSIQVVATPVDDVTYRPTTVRLSCTITSAATRVLQSIAVTTMPTKTVYDIGEALSLAGCVVTGTYNIAPLTEDVTASCTFVPANGTVLSTAGTQSVNVSYGDKSTSFNVTINNARSLDSIAINGKTYREIFMDGNLVSGGDFVQNDSIDYWNGTTTTAKPTASTTGGYVTPSCISVDASSSTQMNKRVDTASRVGHILYGALWAKCTRRSAGYLGAQLKFLGASDLVFTAVSAVTSGYELCSRRETCTGTGGTATDVFVGSMSGANLAGTIDAVEYIDLTAVFGAGSEPTKEQMDTAFAEYGDIVNASVN